MNANGFGRWEQVILVNIPTAEAKEVEKRLSLRPLAENYTQDRSAFIWKRWTNRRGNDEDVVAELFQMLGAPRADFDWEVDWQASDY